MNLKFRYLAIALAATLVVGCSSSGKKELPPAELEKFDAEQTFERSWKRNVGAGQGKLFTQLSPVLDGLTLYAADVRGRILSIQRSAGSAANQWGRGGGTDPG